jgi:large conductance mechanosensitive channel
MGLAKDFRDFVMRGNVVDLAVGVIIGAAFGGIVKSLVDDVMMPPIGKAVGNVNFSDLYISLSDKVDQLNKAKAATQPTADGVIGGAMHAFSTAGRIPLSQVRQMGEPVIAYGNFITLVINFLIVAFCVFLVIKAISSMQKRFEKEKEAKPEEAPAEERLLTEIRDILKNRTTPV